MRRFLPLLLSLIWAGSLSGQEFIPLWNETMPNSRGIPVTDSVENGRFRRVGTPGMYVFHPSAEENTGAAVLICPPGGYGHHTYDLAGLQLAKWYNVMGIHAFVLISRLPHSPDLLDRSTGPLADAQRAMRMIRANASQWGIDENRVGTMGCSAGGHLSLTLATMGEDHSAVGDPCDRYGFRPDFVVLVSPVVTMQEGFAHQGSVRNLLGEDPSEEMLRRFSAEKNIAPDAPPMFMVHADNDPTVPPENSVALYEALKRNGVPSSLHIFPYGKHSIALRNNPGSANLWPLLCEQWLKEMKIKD